MKEKKAPLFAEERKQQILALLKERSKITVPELCAAFDVSPVTVRTDLRDLEAAGLLRRTHGGAIPAEGAAYEPNSSAKEAAHIEEKRRIARAAAAMVEHGDCIAIDTGTTTLELARCLAGRRGLTVVTNDLLIASTLEANLEGSSIILAGGTLRAGFHCTVGPVATASLAGINVDRAFLATNAFHPEKGFCTPDIAQAEVKRALLGMAGEAVMLMDASKLGKVSFYQFAGLSDVQRIITDSSAPAAALAALSEQEGLAVQVV